MKTAVLGVLAGAVLAVVAIAGSDRRDEAFAQRLGAVPANAAGGELIVQLLSTGDKSQLLAVIDPRQRAMGVYQIDPATGKITLWSVRNLQWDLQMAEFNTGNPPPREIRAMLEQR